VKVILLADVPSLGKKGEVKDVADGYARNFLLPKQWAQPASQAAMNALEQKKKAERNRADAARVNALKRAETMQHLVLTIPSKVGEQGKLFGSITTKHVADALAAHGFTIDKRDVLLDEAIRSLGETTVRIKLHQDVFAHVRVRVEKA
jgi:large subunit ribosomal protein L9